MFDAKSKVTKMQGKDYLEVKWRIAWFRDEHPKGGIITEIATNEPISFKATILDAEGRILATGFGTPKMQGVAKSRPFEGAETAAVGRALAHAGYGTQFTDEFDEGEHLADAPIDRPAPETIRERYAKLLAHAESLKIPDVANYALTDKMTDGEIRDLGIELKTKVDAAEKEGK